MVKLFFKICVKTDKLKLHFAKSCKLMRKKTFTNSTQYVFVNTWRDLTFLCNYVGSTISQVNFFR